MEEEQHTSGPGSRGAEQGGKNRRASSSGTRKKTEPKRETAEELLDFDEGEEQDITALTDELCDVIESQRPSET